MKFGIPFLVIMTISGPSGAFASPLTTAELDDQASSSAVHVARLNGTRDVLAQKAALEVTRASLAFNEAEDTVKIVSVDARGDSYSVVVSSDKELTYGARVNDRKFETILRQYDVKFRPGTSHEILQVALISHKTAQAEMAYLLPY